VFDFEDETLFQTDYDDVELAMLANDVDAPFEYEGPVNMNEARGAVLFSATLQRDYY
jgi:hypothetical protein